MAHAARPGANNARLGSLPPGCIVAAWLRAGERGCRIERICVRPWAGRDSEPRDRRPTRTVILAGYRCSVAEISLAGGVDVGGASVGYDHAIGIGSGGGFTS